MVENVPRIKSGIAIRVDVIVKIWKNIAYAEKFILEILQYEAVKTVIMQEVLMIQYLHGIKL